MKKIHGIGTWLCIMAIVLAIIGFVLYLTSVSAGNNLAIASGSESFYDMARPEDSVMQVAVTPCSIIAIICLVAGLILSLIKVEGAAAKVCGVCAGILRIAAPALLMIAGLYFLYGSFTGIGWTFFSNAELAIYPEATAVGTQVIAGIVLMVLAAIVAAIAAYAEIQKKNAD